MAKAKTKAARKPRRVEKVGWYDGVPVPVSELYRDIERLVLRPRLRRDEDGDWPVDVIVVDRTQFRPLHYMPLPYTHDRTADASALRDAGLPALERASEVALHNLRIAVEEFGRVQQDIKLLRDKPEPR